MVEGRDSGCDPERPPETEIECGGPGDNAQRTATAEPHCDCGPRPLSIQWRTPTQEYDQDQQSFHRFIFRTLHAREPMPQADLRTAGIAGVLAISVSARHNEVVVVSHGWLAGPRTEAGGCP
jgi:hypothetical protein